LTERLPAERSCSRREQQAVLGLSAALSIVAFAWGWDHHALLNYGDAVAHLHIARRVIDSHRPGLEQLGSVWLPLPHLLLIPFVAVYRWWADGIAGALPSMLAYLAACTGIYQLARAWLRPLPSCLTLAFFALNPNLLYLQTTAMTEPLFLCEFVWIVLLLVKWRRRLAADADSATRGLWPIACLLIAAIFTRYDGWILALLAWTAIGILLLRRRRLRSPAFWLASLAIVASPLVWFAYNAQVYGDWLDFARGPYSAQAIELRTAKPGGPPHPGWHDPWTALHYFMKCAELDASPGAGAKALLVLSLLGTAWGWIEAHRRAFTWALLLWLPVPFYAYSVAYGSVPIFIPPLWPHSWYNTRYGMEMLPAFALSLGFGARVVLGAVHDFKPRWVSVAACVLFTGVGVNQWLVLRNRPLIYEEGVKNVEARRPLLEEIPPLLRKLLASRPRGEILMETSVYPQLVTETGIPLKQTINESDKEFYQAALAAPAAKAAIVVAFDGDEVDRAVKMHPEDLKAVGRFVAPGQPAATVYISTLRAPEQTAISVIASGKRDPNTEDVGADGIHNDRSLRLLQSLRASYLKHGRRRPAVQQSRA
jgi:hypothetical protein